MYARFKNLLAKILGKKKIVLIVTLWSAVIAFTVIKIFWLNYLLIPYNKDKIYARYDAPAPQLLDVLILIVASLVVTFLISTPNDLVYGYVASLFLSFSIGVVYVFLYIWYIQGYGVYFATGPFDWEIPLFYAILNVFRIMFPSVAATSLIGSLIGFLVRSLTPNQFKYA